MLEIKDHYSALELSPSASPEEIRKAYRRLAQQYHPDKTGDDPRAKAQFNAIKEAYETLSQPQRKEAYLQERWLAQSMGMKDRLKPTTTTALLQKLLALERRIYQQDAYRSDYQGWMHQIEMWLSGETIDKIKEFQDGDTEMAAFECCIRIADKLPFPAIVPLQRYAQNLTHSAEQMHRLEQKIAASRQKARFEKLAPFLAALIVILLCLIIFLA